MEPVRPLAVWHLHGPSQWPVDTGGPWYGVNFPMALDARVTVNYDAFIAPWGAGTVRSVIRAFRVHQQFVREIEHARSTMQSPREVAARLLFAELNATARKRRTFQWVADSVRASARGPARRADVRRAVRLADRVAQIDFPRAYLREHGFDYHVSRQRPGTANAARLGDGIRTARRGVTAYSGLG